MLVGTGNGTLLGQCPGLLRITPESDNSKWIAIAVGLFVLGTLTQAFRFIRK